MFKEGDKVRRKKGTGNCSAAFEGKTYTVRGDLEGTLIIGEFAESEKHGCICYNQWELVEEYKQNNTNIMENDTPTKETEISRVMEGLGKAVECLTQSVDATEARLSAIVRNSNPNELKEQGRVPYETNLAQEINKIHDRIQGLRERLDDLVNRLEL